MLRFIAYAVPLLILQLALFGFAVELLDAEPKAGSVIRLALLEQPRVPGLLVLGTWLVEASGLLALFLLTQGRLGKWWLEGLVVGWIAWIFRGPLLVITIVVAARQPQDPWWSLAFGWWVLYSICGLSLAILARRSGLAPWPSSGDEAAASASGVDASAAADKSSGDETAAKDESAAEPEAVEATSEVSESSPQEPEAEDSSDVEAEEAEGGADRSGAEDAGAEDPGAEDPGEEDAGPEDPGAEDAGPDAGPEDPGAENAESSSEDTPDLETADPEPSTPDTASEAAKGRPDHDNS